MAIELTEAQKQSVRQWAQDGCGLSEIQKRMASEFGMSPTYMDVRFLVIELGLEIKERPGKATVAAELKAAPDTGEAPDGGGPLQDRPAPAGAGVTVDVDRVMKPGSLVSGTVTFSDGVAGTWMLDQFGRLAISTSRPGYKPNPQDVQAFQAELRSLLEARGF